MILLWMFVLLFCWLKACMAYCIMLSDMLWLLWERWQSAGMIRPCLEWVCVSTCDTQHKQCTWMSTSWKPNPVLPNTINHVDILSLRILPEICWGTEMWCDIVYWKLTFTKAFTEFFRCLTGSKTTKLCLHENVNRRSPQSIQWLAFSWEKLEIEVGIRDQGKTVWIEIIGLK